MKNTIKFINLFASFVLSFAVVFAAFCIGNLVFAGHHLILAVEIPLMFISAIAIWLYFCIIPKMMKIKAENNI